MFDIFSDLDLDDIEAEWSLTTTTTKKTRFRPGSRTDWKAREKGAKVDKTSYEYRQEAAAASLGLPHFARMQYLAVQMLDRGEMARTRYSLKFEAVDAGVEKCTRAGLQAMARVRWCNLTSAPNFRTNCRKRRWRDAKKNREQWGPEIWAISDELAGHAETFNANRASDADPEAMLGFVSFPFEGVTTYAGQFGLLCWRQDEDTGPWLPRVIVTHLTGDGQGGWDARRVDLRVPPAIRRDGQPRSPIAISRYPFVGAWYSDALQERITAGREIKAMRAADIAVRGGGS